MAHEPDPPPVEEQGEPPATDPRVERLRERFGEALLAARASATGLEFQVTPEIVPEFVRALREDILAAQHGFSDLCGVEREEGLEAIYRFFVVTERLQIVVRVRLARDKPVLPTLTHLYAGASWPEREISEMFGIQVTGHPDMRHLLLPEGWEGYPLRKDYRYPEEHPYLARDPLRENPAEVLSRPDRPSSARAVADEDLGQAENS